jgi:monofunctional biosynthetic peptidoglycan transglycosylase
MLLRRAEGAGMERRPVPLEAVAPALGQAVIAAEDSRFCLHHGFDWSALAGAWARNQDGGRLAGGSTISMQTAKNAFLWPGRNWLRKGFEAWFTFWMELSWPKRRILEVYLDIVEWGDGLYGAEAAAQRYFGKPAKDLKPREAALLAAVLPNPRRWSPARPTAYIRSRAAVIERRMVLVERGGLAACVER